MKEELLLKDATAGDWPTIAEVTRLSYGEYAQASDPEFWTNYEASTRKTLLEENNAQRVVGQLDGQIVATVLLCPPYELNLGKKLVRNSYPEMRLLAVLPQFRNLHIGARLIDECERRVQAEGFDAITLHTTLLMQTAKSMYERRGYVRYPEIDFEPAPGFVVWGYKKQFE
jgi:ribosomal protein S18 acetylase RimI-like enzyme